MTGVELAISTSFREMSIALRSDGEVTERSFVTKDANLHEVVAELAGSRSVSASDIRTIHVDRGPGSYTGLRIAVTFARVLSRYADVALRATTSFELIASALDASGEVCIGLDARRGRVHTANLALDDSIGLLDEPRAIPTEEFVASLRVDTALVLDASLTEALDGLPCEARPLPKFRASAMFDARVETREITREALEPLYLMGSYAE